jgi:hypothetical protein
VPLAKLARRLEPYDVPLLAIMADRIAPTIRLKAAI